MRRLPVPPLGKQSGDSVIAIGFGSDFLTYCNSPPQEDFYAALAKIKAIVSKPILTQEELDLVDAKVGSVGVTFCHAFFRKPVSDCLVCNQDLVGDWFEANKTQ